MNLIGFFFSYVRGSLDCYAVLDLPYDQVK